MRPRLYCQRVFKYLELKMDSTMVFIALIILTPLFGIKHSISALRGSHSYQHPSNEAIQGSYITLFPIKFSSVMRRYAITWYYCCFTAAQPGRLRVIASKLQGVPRN